DSTGEDCRPRPGRRQAADVARLPNGPRTSETVGQKPREERTEMTETTTGSTLSAIGPVDYLIVGFPGNQFKGEVGPAIADLVEAGTIRIIYIAFVGKNGEGDTVAFELSELDPDVRAGLEKAGVANEGGLFNEDDLMSIADGLEPNSSAALLVWEN